LPGWLNYLSRILPDRGNFIMICANLRSIPLLVRFARHFRRHSRFPMLAIPTPGFVMGPDMSDHWSFWHCGYPALMVTDTSFLRNGNYHTTRDTPETLCYPAMARIVHGAAEALARLAGEMR
jgi:hypothetical protein